MVLRQKMCTRALRIVINQEVEGRSISHLDFLTTKFRVTQNFQ